MGDLRLSPEQMTFSWCQRWQAGRASYRPAGEPLRPDEYGVEPIGEAPAKAFVEAHHYSGSYPAARYRAGLFRTSRAGLSQLVGVAVFSVPMNNRVIPKYTGLSPLQGVELGRFVLLDEIPANAESWFLARAFDCLRADKPEIGSVVAYSDPVPRRTQDGATVLPGHVGCIYQAHNGQYLGRGSKRTLLMHSTGVIFSDRTRQKILSADQGREYAHRQLRALGASAPRFGEDPKSYLDRAIEEAGFRRIRHPGNHVYAWPLGSARQKRQLLTGFAQAVQYPKGLDVAVAA